jgi:hypothetical protein
MGIACLLEPRRPLLPPPPLVPLALNTTAIAKPRNRDETLTLPLLNLNLLMSQYQRRQTLQLQDIVCRNQNYLVQHTTTLSLRVNHPRLVNNRLSLVKPLQRVNYPLHLRFVNNRIEIHRLNLHELLQ